MSSSTAGQTTPADQQIYETFRAWVTQLPPRTQGQPDVLTQYREVLRDKGLTPQEIDRQMTIIDTQGQRLEIERWNQILTNPNPTFNTEPNAFLVQIAKNRTPGTALDVGMGQGRNAIYLAQHGWQVSLIDTVPDALEKATATIRTNLERQVKKGSLAPDAPIDILGRIATATALDAAAEASLVLEAASENPAVKFAVFEQLDRLAAPEAILAKNTSSISSTEIAARTRRPGQVIGMHFMNPVPVMQLVEVIRGHATTDATTRTVMDTASALGKTPVEVNDYPGFVANRVLMPMINEAVFCVMEGVAAPEAIDTVMKLGMAHPMGPLQLADFIGLDVCLAILEVLHRGLGDDKYRPAPLLRRMVAAGYLGRKSGRGFYDYREAK